MTINRMDFSHSLYIPLILLYHFTRQVDKDCCPFIFYTVCPYFTVMCFDNFFRNCKPETCAAHFTRTAFIHSVKTVKNPLYFIIRYAKSVVFYTYRHPVIYIFLFIMNIYSFLFALLIFITICKYIIMY